MSEQHSTPTRAVAYYRKSNTDDGKSVGQQREWAVSACKAEGLDLTAEFTDQAKPGHETARRTEFLRMSEWCEAEAAAGRPVGAVVCWAADRFSRSDSFETGAFIWRLMQAGVGRMLTAAEGWIDFADSNARIIFNVTQDTGRHQYVRQLAQAALRGRIDSAKRGRWMTRAPWGYRLEGERLAIDPDAAPHARWLFQHCADAEDGVMRVAQALTERGVPSPGGKGPWTANAVHCVLRNPVYLGDTVFGKRISGKFFAMLDLRPAPRPAKRKSRQIRDGLGDCVVSRNTHPALVDLPTWERCQAKLKRNRGRGGPRHGQLYLFAGLLVCGNCGRRMCGAFCRQKRNGRAWSYQTYICSSYNESGAEACGRNTVREDALLRGVARRIAERFSDPEEIRAGLAALLGQAGEQKDAEADRRESRMAELRRLHERSAKRFLELDDDRSAEACRKQMEAWSAELRTLEREHAAAAPALPSVEEQVEEAMEFHCRFQEALKEPDRPLLRRLLLEFVAQIDLHFARRKVVERSMSAFVRGTIFRRVEVGQGSDPPSRQDGQESPDDPDASSADTTEPSASERRSRRSTSASGRKAEWRGGRRGRALIFPSSRRLCSSGRLRVLRTLLFRLGDHLVQGRLEFRLQLKAALEILLGLGVLPLKQSAHTSPAVCRRLLRIEFDDLVAIGDDAIGIAFLVSAFGPIDIRTVEPGIQLDGFGVVGDGAVPIAFLTSGNATIQVGDDELGIQLDGFGVVRNGVVQIAFFPPFDAATIVGHGVLGIQFDGFGEIGDGAVRIAFFFPTDSAIPVGHGELGIQFDGFVVVGDGTVPIAFFTSGKATIIVGHGVLGIEFNGFAAVRSEAVPIAFFPPFHAAIIVGIGVLGIQLDGFGVVGDGAVRIAFFPPSDAAIIVGHGELGFRIVGVGEPGIQLDGFGVVRNGAIQIAFLPPCDGAIMVGVGVLGIQFDGFGVVRNLAVRIAFFPRPSPRL